MTTDFVIGVGVGIVPGVMLGAATALGVYRGLVTRLAYRNELETTAEKLQKDREAKDSGRDELLRDNTGPPGEVHRLLSERPGSLARHHLQEQEMNTRKRPKGVERQGF